MEFIVEVLVEIVAEFVVQIVFEALSEVGLRIVRKPSRRSPPGPWVAVAGYVILGALCGAVSLWLFPTFLVESHAGRVASLVVTPVMAGAAMALLGAWRRKRGQEMVRLDRFAYGYVFALSMAAVRFSFGQLA